MPDYPSFVETKHLIVDEYDHLGSTCSSRKSHRIARALFNMRERGGATWSLDDEPDLVKDPTGREAVRRVMSRMEGPA